MYDHRITGFDQEVTVIHPGEYLATSDDVIISTVLGSCVAVALKDTKVSIGGLNHFMLPGCSECADSEHFSSASAKYGMYAMELLINELLKMGCRKERLVAKVFGGAAVLKLGLNSKNRVPANNVDFAFKYLSTEGIPILTSDVGGSSARKILFFVHTGKVLLKRISGTILAAVEQNERSYLARIEERERSVGDITLFDT